MSADRDVESTYRRVVTSIDDTLREIAVDPILTSGCRRFLLHLILGSLPTERRDELVECVTDLGDVWLRGVEHDDTSFVAAAAHRELRDTTAVVAAEVAAAIAAAVVAYQQAERVTP
jgi:hypothetical protein